MPLDPLRRARPLLRALFGRPALENDMQAEMGDHIERATQRLIARGMSPEQARLEAKREFGNVAVTQENARDARGSRWLEALSGDVRFAFRYFARHRATVAIIVIVLAIGTGANTMLFSLFQAQFLRPAPAVPYDGRMARIWAQERATKTSNWLLRGFTWSEIRSFADRRDLFDEVAAYATQNVILGGRDGNEARAVSAQFVTSNFFSALRVQMAGGAGFVRAANEIEPAEKTAVMSHAMATTLFGDAASAVGKSVFVNDVALRIVGVAPAEFQGAMRKMGADVWIPLSARAEIAGISPRWVVDSRALYPFARMAAGASHEEATEFARRTVISALPDSAARVGMSRTADVMSMIAVPPGPDRLNTIMMFAVLGTAGVLILVVGWMNVSSLMVAAAVARRQEIAVRLSLGASRLRLLRQLVTESTVLALAGGVAGLAMAWGALTLLVKLDADGMSLLPDVGTFAFALGIALMTGILFGLSPALHATGGEVGTAIRDSGAGTTGKSRLQRNFVTAQIALSQPLLVMLGTLLWLLANDFDATLPEMGRRTIVVNATPVPRSGQWGQPVADLDTLVKRIAEHPQVVAVVPEGTQFDKGWVQQQVAGVGQQVAEDGRTMVNLHGIAPGWFAMAEVPIILGRDVSLADTAGTAAIPVVIGSDMAKALWGNVNPIGRTLAAPQLQDMQDADMVVTVVGVYDASRGVPNVTGNGSGSTEKQFEMYSARGSHWRSDYVLVRTRGMAEPLVNDLRQLIRERVPALPIESIETLEQMEIDMNQESLQGAALAGAGGVIALLLTSLGLYGVVSLAVQQRTREIGIRIAVGANPAGVTKMFLRSGIRLAGIALLIGLPVTVAGMVVGQSTGVINEGPNFWIVGLGVSVVLLAVAGAATWGPARRASLVDPAIALRVE